MFRAPRCTFLAVLGITAISIVPVEYAAAAATSETTFTNITITLIDLDLTDGIDPALVFGTASTLSKAYVDPLNADPIRPSTIVIRQNADNVDGFLATSSASLTLGGVTLFAASSPDSLTARAAATSGFGWASASATAFSSYFLEDGEFGFVLTSNSAFTITGFATLMGSSDGASIGSRYWEQSSAYGSASMSLSRGDVPPELDPMAQSVFIELPATGWSVPQSVEKSRLLSLTFTNDSLESVNGMLAIGISARVFSPAPEPQTQLLMLAGIGMMALWARRKGARDREPA